MSLKDFEILNKLGEGSFSTVYKVRRRSDNTIYALKKVKFGPLKDKEKQNSLNEIRILASVNHPNIIGYREAFLDENGNNLWELLHSIVMEYADQGDLFSKIQRYKSSRTRFSEQEIWDIFLQVLRGLKALHDLKILHRDLKSANIFLFTNGTVKLGDMNVSKPNCELAYTQTGTPYYASPEVWKDEPYDSKSDIWSLGVVLYEAILLKPPFTATDMKSLFKRVVAGAYPPIPSSFSSDLRNLIEQLLQVNPESRPSCERLLKVSRVNRHSRSDTHIESNSILLNTIRLPSNLSSLGKELPAAKYELKSRNPSVYSQRLAKSNREISLKLPNIEKSVKYNERFEIRPLLHKVRKFYK